MTWIEYWLKHSWNLTVGKAPDRQGAYHPVNGRWNSGAPFRMGQPGTLPEVLGLPENAVALDTHGFGFVDTTVMDEWAAANAPELEGATQNDRDLGRFLSQDGVASFGQAVAKWAEGRKPEEVTAPGPKAPAVVLDKLDAILAALGRIEAKGELTPTEKHADAEAAITRPR